MNEDVDGNVLQRDMSFLQNQGKTTLILDIL